MVRWMLRRDLIEVLAIDQQLNEDEVLQYLRQRNSIAIVFELNDKVVGYVFYSLHKNCIHVTHLGVHPHFRQQHIGTQLIERLVSKLSSRRSKISLEVPETNLVLQQFLRALHFKATRVLRQHFGEEDGYAFEYEKFAEKVLEFC